MDLVMLVFRPWTARVARRVLVGRSRVRGAPEKGRFTRADIDALVKRAWQTYEQRAPGLRPQPTPGSTMNQRLACFTLSFFDELLGTGVERAHAIELVADAAWGIYRAWARAARLMYRHSALGFAPQTIASGASLRFPFNAPGYLIEPVRAERGTAFDVVRCPVASYFREHGAADLCLAAWCNLDFPLSEITHQRLVRTKTLVEGANRCDFRVLSRELEVP
jgi:ubiquinone biosynthesis protein